jgi:hypothetical protein
MKQLLSLFLFLVPCLAWAQYPSNGNQKITLGEQTTADGLIYRGVLADTGIITPLSDTSAYIILDTVNHRFYNYNRATNVWSVAGGGTSVTTFSGGTTGLTPSTATSGAVTLGGTLAVANGGTNASTFTAGSVVFAGASGTYTQDNSNLFYDNTNDRLGIITASPNYKLHVKTGESGRTLHDQRMKIQIESELESYYSINVPSNGYGGFRVHTTPASAASAVFEYWAPNKKFYFLTGGFYEFNDKNNNKLLTIDSTGFIGLNQVTPTERLHVVGNARITGNVGIGVTTPTNAIDMVGQIRMTGATIASGLTKNINISGAQNFTDDEVKTISAGNVTFIMVSDNNTGGGALFFASYASGTVVKIADPSNFGSVTDLDGFVCVYKNASSATINVKNRLGSTKSITVSQITVGD